MSKMKKNAVLVVSVALLLIMVLVNTILAEHEHKGKPSNAEVLQKTQRLQMPFIVNEGQTDEKVAFYANTFGGTVFVTKDGEIVYSLPRVAHASPLGHDEINKGKTGYTGLTGYRGKEGRCIIHRTLCTMYPYCTWNFPGYYSETSSLICHTDSPVCHSERSEESYLNNSQSEIRNPKSKISGIALREEFIGAKVSGIKGEGESVTRVSYFKGNDPSRWKTNIATYEVVNLGEIYKGIELKLKAHGDNVEKLLYVKPGAVPEQIKISLSGLKPFECKGKQSPASPFSKGNFADIPLNKGGEGVVFLGNEKRIPETFPLIKGIQGLSVNEHGELVAETELGPVKFTKPVAYQEIDGKRVEIECGYVISDCGIQETSDVGWVKRSSPNKNGLNGLNPLNDIDGFASLNPSYPCQLLTFNSQPAYGFKVASYDRTKDLIIDPLLASTYLGGSGNDFGHSLTLDIKGNVYVTGVTYSSNFPATSGAYDTSFNGGYTDVFVSKLDGGLTSLLASTFLGGASSDDGSSLTLDTIGNVYVTGYTYSTDFPTTSVAYDTSFNGYTDVFVSKLDSGLTSLLSSTFLGGSFYDLGNFLALDTSGNVYVTGVTYSSSFPTTIGAYDTSFNGGYDVFVSKLDGNLSASAATTPTPSPTPSPNPLITTGAATNITSSSATLNGTVNANGLTTTAWFEYGKSSGSYSSKSSTQNLSGSNNTPISIGISGLSAGTKYYYKIVAKNSASTSYGNEMSFATSSTTSVQPPPFGLTIITHGYQSDTNEGGWVDEMARAIASKFGGITKIPIYTMKIYTDFSASMTPDEDVLRGLDFTTAGGAIIKVDWSDLDGGDPYDCTNFIPTKKVADAIYKNILSSWFEVPIHLIGHSRAASVNTELAYDLGVDGIWVDHFTSLDPQPITHCGDVPIKIYDNILFADNNYRNEGVLPWGEPVKGTYIPKIVEWNCYR